MDKGYESTPYEIERKYLTNFKSEEEVKVSAEFSRSITSIYILNSESKTIRVVCDTLPYGFCDYKMTMKRSTSDPRIRIEKEHSICKKTYETFEHMGYPTISKNRYIKNIDDTHYWEIDVFKDYPFIIAEVEMNFEEKDIDFSKNESWITAEVTDDPSYLNCNLAK